MSRVIFPPDHPCEVILTSKESGAEVHRVSTVAELLGGCLTTIRITWNALSVSGGVCWVHPGNGQHFPRGLTFRIETLHPVTGETVEIDY